MKWIQNIIARMRSRYAFRRLTNARRMAVEWERDSEALKKRLTLNIKRLRTLQDRLESLSKSITEDLEQGEQIQRQQAVVVESLRNENRVLQEVLVPSLTAANSVMLQRYDTELSLLVKRQVAATKQEE